MGIPRRASSKGFHKPANQSAGILDDHRVGKNVATQEGSIERTPTANNHIVNKKYVDDNDHAESHNIASHSDTSATGAELNSLTNNSFGDTLHRHSELVAPDGIPDPAVSINAAGDLELSSVARRINLGDTNNYIMRGAFICNTSVVVGSFATGKNVTLYAPTHIGLGNDTKMIYDNKKLFFGGGDDCSIYYDATNMIINPKEVGSGYLNLQGEMRATERITSGTKTITASSDDLDVSGVNIVFVDTTGGDIILGGLTGGVNGQLLHFAVIGNFSNNIKFEHAEGIGGSQDFMNYTTNDERILRGGIAFVCNGTNWYMIHHTPIL